MSSDVATPPQGRCADGPRERPSASGQLLRAWRRARGVLPVGRGLSDEVWRRRHHGIVILLTLHVPALVVFGVLCGTDAARSIAVVAPVAVCAVVAATARSRSRGFQSGVATLGLVTCSALLVYFSRGTIEMHFHFFVMVGVITLYQDWLPFGLALAFVLLDHGLIGVLDPSAVFNTKTGQRNPWLWAAIHTAFLLAACVAHVLAWRLNEDQALRDSLTRLPNRTLFADRLRVALARRERVGTPVTVLFVDLDGFKAVNDSLGHHGGDGLLVVVARRLVASVREFDTVARFGGDEFAILLDNTDMPEGMRIAERVLAEVRRPARLEGREVVVGASVGLMTVDHELAVDDVLRNADLAMYLAKSSGRGRVEIFEDGMAGHIAGRAELEVDLRAAITAGEIEVYYQPTVELDSGGITGMEALARWTHPERGPIPPNVFIPIAEAAGLIAPLGRFVLGIACADAAIWRVDHPTLTVAVNVSLIQLASEQLVEDVAAALRASGLDPQALVLELTESVLAQDFQTTADRLRALKALGVRIAIDDFGTGYSSLSYLRHFPIDILKIDRSFVDQLPGDGTALAASIVRLGDSLNMEIVAEGVEDDAQRDELRRLGCRHGQGFLFAPAKPAQTIDSLLESSAATGRWWDARTAASVARPPAIEAGADTARPPRPRDPSLQPAPLGDDPGRGATG